MVSEVCGTVRDTDTVEERHVIIQHICAPPLTILHVATNVLRRLFGKRVLISANTTVQNLQYIFSISSPASNQICIQIDEIFGIGRDFRKWSAYEHVLTEHHHIVCINTIIIYY